jgi:hypothetical protein
VWGVTLAPVQRVGTPVTSRKDVKAHVVRQSAQLLFCRAIRFHKSLRVA